MSNEIKDKAKEYSKAQLSVILTTEDKTPALYQWENLQHKPLSNEEIDTLFSGGTIRPEIERLITKKDKTTFIAKGIKTFKNPVGIGIITGAISGGLEVIDVDTKHDDTGSLWEELRALIEGNLSELYSKLVIAQTKSGGYHIYYRCSSIAGNLKLSLKANREVLVETRGEGGYVVAPPTQGYKYIQGEPDNIPTITPEDRERLLNISKSFNELEEVKPKVNYTTSATYNSTGLSPFDDYNQRGDIVGLLESNGWKVVTQRGQRINLLRAGSTDSKTSGNFHTGLRTLRVFSSSTEFSTEKAYSPSQVFSLLECNEDNKLTYRRLLDMGFGEPYKGEEIRPTQVKTEKIKVDVVNSVNRETSVISTAGETLKIENIQAAIGEEVIITSPDSEATEEVLKAIALIQETGKRIYIREGATEIREYSYQLNTIFKKYGAIQANSGVLTDRQRDSLLDEVIIVSTKLQPVDRDIFLKHFLSSEATQELGISKENLSITVDRLTSTREKEAQAKSLQELLKKVKEHQDKGETDKALDLLNSQVKEVRRKNKATQFKKLWEIPTEESIKEFYKKAPDSLKSGYKIAGEELLLPTGGLTGIAGATGHGKTDFLINLTLNAALQYPDKVFYFFTYEMSQEAILVRFLNTYLDMDLEKSSNQRAIKTYFKTDSVDYIKREARKDFLVKKDTFFRELIATGRLRVKGINFSATDLNIAFFDIYTKEKNIGGFFIDYFQLLRLPEEKYSKKSRVDELKVICQDLNQVAQDLMLPIILGAQFNREVTNPLKLHPTNIGEAGDIERILDTLIGIWFTNKKVVAQKEELKIINELGLTPPDILYTYVLKSRETASDISELLDYNAMRGKIENSSQPTVSTHFKVI
jgi:hypothetical protein